MFFREKIISGSTLLQLVESYRNEDGLPRQRIVASLGGAEIPLESRKRIAHFVELRLKNTQDFFYNELTELEAEWIDKIFRLVEQSTAKNHGEPKAKEHVDLKSMAVDKEEFEIGTPCKGKAETIDGVLIDEIESFNVVDFGSQLVGIQAWEALELSAKLTELGMSESSIALAQSLVINRLVEPLSEWAAIDWFRGTCLPECLGIRVTQGKKDRLYRVGDELFRRRKEIEEFLRDREENLFNQRGNIVLYDVTNTHFEGLALMNPKAKRGRNKQKRHDAVQVAIGMAYNEFGNSLCHEVFEGNISDANTILEVIKRLEVGGSYKKKTIIIDAGIATKDNLNLLRENGYSYIVNITRSSRSKYLEEFTTDDFTEVFGRDKKEPVEVKFIDDPEGSGDRLILCQSSARREKEMAMISGADKRFLAAVEKLRNRVAKGQLKDEKKILKNIGALKAKNQRVARFYTITYQDSSLDIQCDDKALADARELCGTYVLRTDRELDPTTVWNLYMTLLKAEEGFKMLKGTLGLRPNFHQLQKRVEAHIFITILAYHLLCWIQNKLTNVGDSRTWKTIRRLLRTHCIVSTRLPMDNGKVMIIRKPSTPEAAQQLIYDELGIDWRTAYRPRKFATII